MRKIVRVNLFALLDPENCQLACMFYSRGEDNIKVAAQASWNDEARERSGNSRSLWLGKSLLRPWIQLMYYEKEYQAEAGFRELLTSRSGRSPRLRSAQPFVIFKSGNFTQRKLLHPIGDKQLQTSLYQPLTFRGFLSQGVRALTLSTNF